MDVFAAQSHIRFTLESDIGRRSFECLRCLLRKNQYRLSDKSMVPQGLRPTPWDKVEHIGGAMKSTCYMDRVETTCGNGCAVLLLLFAHGALSLCA